MKNATLYYTRELLVSVYNCYCNRTHFLHFAESYNHYVETIGYVVRANACGDINIENNVLCISGNTPLFHILPKQTTEEEGRDFLFVVIENIVSVIV